MAKVKNMSAVFAELERIERVRLERVERYKKYRNCDRCQATYSYTHSNSHFCDPCRDVLKKERAAAHHQNRRSSEEGKQKLREQSKQAYQTHRNKILSRAKINNQILKCEVIAHYGGKCKCCNESIIDFLCIDHINDDGAEHRRSLKIVGGIGMYRWIKSNNFPSNLQVLCHNCNMAKAISGICPHQIMKEAAA